MGRRLATWFCALLFLAGAAVTLYPTAGNLSSALGQRGAILEYIRTVEDMEAEGRQALLRAAAEYNADPTRGTDYARVLAVTGDGQMGYLEIPGIRCLLPIFHGTGEEELARGVGHLEGTSLPVGGPGTHTVLSGHSGLPGAQLLTDLGQLEVGDIFYVHVVGESLAYQVEEILVVTPVQTAALAIRPGEDLCTLVTCTPYGVNTHRLLVQGRRMEG